MFHTLDRLKKSPGHGVLLVTSWGTESRAPAWRSAACWAASAPAGGPQRRTLRLRAALHQALRRSGGQPHLQAMALHSCSKVGVGFLWSWYVELEARLRSDSASHPLCDWYRQPQPCIETGSDNCTATLYRGRAGYAARQRVQEGLCCTTTNAGDKHEPLSNK